MSDAPPARLTPGTATQTLDRDLPIPPAALLIAVAGNDDTTWFIEGGRRGAESILECLGRNHITLSESEAVLDFGCGCGRVIRHLRALTPAKLYGTDWNAELVHWCEKNLQFAEFQTNQLCPPLEYDESRFDLICALSVVTHLSEELQLAWFEEFRRLLKPGGHVYFTTHGESYLEIMTADEQLRFQRGELVVRRSDASGSNDCATFHPEAWVRRILAEQFNVIDFIAQGAEGNPHQDAWLVCRK